MRHWKRLGRCSPGLIGLLAMGEGSTLLLAPALGQVVPDTTLGADASMVVPDVDVRGDTADLINGGALRGENLFHSFEQFGIVTNQRVYFSNPAGINNIVSRVTGMTGSDINGTLGVDGSANLFLINPNGIVFGTSAQLDVDGAFLASTADRISFGDGNSFRATNPNAAPLVAVNIPLGAQFGNPSAATLQSDANLTAGSDLTLSAGTIVSNGALTSVAGQVILKNDSGGNININNAIDTSGNGITIEGTVNFNAGTSISDTISGSSGVDIFNFNGGAVATVNGGDGNDIFRFNAGAINQVGGGPGNDRFEFNGDSAVRANGNGGNDSFNFNAGSVIADTAVIQGGTDNDSFNLKGGVVNSIVSGDLVSDTSQSGIDIVRGTGGVDIFLIEGNGRGQVDANSSAASPDLRFMGIEILDGLNNSDTYRLADGISSLAIAINDSGSGDTDVLSFASYTSNPNVSLDNINANGIEHLEGSAQTDVNSMLIGRNGTTNEWQISGANSGTVSSSGQTFSFSRFNRLRGGDDVDKFDISSGGTLDRLEGGAGDDSFNPNGGTVNSRVTGDLVSDSFLGGTDTVQGTPDSDTFLIDSDGHGEINGFRFAQIETLDGLNNSDTYELADGIRTSAIDIDDSGSGDTDVLSFANYTSDPDVSLNDVDANGVEHLTGSSQPNVDSTLTGLDGTTNTWQITGNNRGNISNSTQPFSFSNFNRLRGGNQIDRFNVLNPSSSIDRLEGREGNDTFNLNAGSVNTVNGNNGNDIFNLNGSSIARISGGNNNDIFNFNDNSAVNANGNGGNDTFNFNSGTIVATAVIQGGVDDDSFYLNGGVVDSTISGDLATNTSLSGTDTIQGTTGADLFLINNIGSGEVHTDGDAATPPDLSFIGIEVLNGASNGDTYRLVDDINTSSINIDDQGSLVDEDVLSFANYTRDFEVALSDITANGIETLEGSQSVVSTLAGRNGQDNDWAINNVNQGTVTFDGQSFNFIDFQQLRGGNQVDIFALNPGGNIDSLEGGTGDDIFNLSGGSVNTISGNGGNDTFNLDGSSINQISGGAGNDTFEFNSDSTVRANGNSGDDIFNFNNGTVADTAVIQGGVDDDSFNLNGGVINSIISGDLASDTSLDGSDTVQGTAGADFFLIEDTGRGEVGTDDIAVTPPDLRFIGIEVLNGARGSDTYRLTDGIRALAIDINDTGPEVTDLLSFANYTSDLQVSLNDVDADGVEFLEGSVQPGVTSTLLGHDGLENNWEIIGTRSGQVSNIDQSFSFFRFDILKGGNQIDTFDLRSGSIDSLEGGAGNDTFTLNGGTVLNGLDGGAAIDAVEGTTVNDIYQVLSESTATIAGITVNSIEVFDGRGGENRVLGTDQADVFQITGNDSGTVDLSATDINNPLPDLTYRNVGRLEGDAGDDIFTFNGGRLSAGLQGGDNTENGGDVVLGEDNTAEVFKLVSIGQGVLDEDDDLTNGIISQFEGIERVNGRGGDDLVEGLATADTFTISGLNAGQTAGIRFSNIEAFDGGTGENKVEGLAGTDTFTLSGTNAGQSSGIDFSNIGAFDGGTGENKVEGLAEADTFTISENNIGQSSGIDFSNIEVFDGRGGDDTIAGLVEADTFTISGNNAGQASGIRFSNIETFNGQAGDDTIMGVAGTDTFTLSGTNVGQSAGIRFSNIETFDGQGGDDTVEGLAGVDTFIITDNNRGQSSNITFSNIETFDGQGGDDTVEGLAGADTFIVIDNNRGQSSNIIFDNVETFDGQTGENTLQANDFRLNSTNGNNLTIDMMNFQAGNTVSGALTLRNVNILQGDEQITVGETPITFQNEITIRTPALTAANASRIAEIANLNHMIRVDNPTGNLRIENLNIRSGVGINLANAEAEDIASGVVNRTLDLVSTRIDASAVNVGDDAGDIDIKTGVLTLNNGSTIISAAEAGATPGEVKIQATQVMAGPATGPANNGNDIISRSGDNPGAVALLTPSLTGFIEQPAVPNNGTNDIEGVGNIPAVLSDELTIDVPAIALNETPPIQDRCANNIADVGELSIIGRGGLPPNPTALLTPGLGNDTSDWISVDPILDTPVVVTGSNGVQIAASPSKQGLCAQGWSTLNRGL